MLQLYELHHCGVFLKLDKGVFPMNSKMNVKFESV